MIALALSSFRHYAWSHLRVCAGIALASAVLTGALLVGDSIDYSLKAAATARLGGVHYAIDTRNQFVREEFPDALAANVSAPIAAALHVRGMAIFQPDPADSMGRQSQDRAQVNRVSVYGVEDEFFALGHGNAIRLEPLEVALSEQLANALGAAPGDEISLRIARPSLMSRDSPLSWRDEDRTWRGRFTVTAVLPDDGVGRFGLSPTQTPPYNAFINLAFLQERLEFGPRVNLVLVGESISVDVLHHALNDVWEPEHLGLNFRAGAAGVVQLESDRIFLDGETARAAMTLPGARGTFTYLVNSMSAGDRLTPYFFVVAGPVAPGMKDEEVVINRWVADEIGAGTGDRVTLEYAELLPSNEFATRSREFTVHSVREMEDLVEERGLMPEYPGLSDVESCSDWDVGMPMDEELLNDEANEAYWEEYRDTPKSFVTLAAGQQMWGNRFGDLTAVRIPGTDGDVSELRGALKAEMDPALAGLRFEPVREQAMAAVSQAMGFGGLFLGMSSFLIVASLLLTGLLFAFGIEQRADQMGTLLALGFRAAAVERLLILEGLIVAVVGSAIGAIAGIGYTRALIFALTQFWGGAVAHATILFHARPLTIVLGMAATLICAVGTMYFIARRNTRRLPTELLSGVVVRFEHTDTPNRARSLARVVAIAATFGSVALVSYALLFEVQNVAPIFFGSGALLLVAGLAFFRHQIGTAIAAKPGSALSLPRLAILNLARRPSRSVVVAGLVACGVFLVLGVSSMQEDLRAHASSRTSGTGGFTLVADSTFALQENPAAVFDDPSVLIVPVKVRDGDDASCLNLNRAQTPALLGVNVEEFASRGAFADAELWRLLERESPGGEIPALVGDSNTAMWTLRRKTGVERGDVLVYQDQDGREVRVKLVGQLPMRLSVFQGMLLISQEHFTRLFPSEDGFRMFLIDSPEAEVPTVAGTLVRGFDRYGMDVVPSVQRLYEFYSVEASYLAMFLVLGGLGVAVGTLGLAVVILRNLYERRGEMAMMNALGFSKSRLSQVALIEFGVLVAAGLGIGGVSAVVSMLPAHLAAMPTIAAGNQALVAALVIAASITSMWVAVAAAVSDITLSALRNE